MKRQWLFGAVSLRRMAAYATAASFLGASGLVYAATDIQVWVSLNPYNKKAFEDLVKDFNKSQSDVQVDVKSFDTVGDIEKALEGKSKGKNAPSLVQLNDTRAPDNVAKRAYIQPLYTLLAKYPIKDAKWFLSDDNTFLRDAKGRLVAFPYMVDVPVMYYNVDAFSKAGLTPSVPARSWKGLQDQLVTLANNGSRKCPLTTDEPVSVNLENLGSLNNQPYTSGNNGLQAKASPSFQFDLMYVRHLSMMISWARSELLVKPELGAQSVKRFSDRECAVLMSSSSNIGSFKDARGLKFGVSGLPYYPEVTPKPGNAFVGGDALWAIAGQSAEQSKAAAQLLAFLARPANAAQWYQSTGFLPLTEQAFQQTEKSYYKSMGEWEQVVSAYSKAQVSTARGFRVKNYPKIKAMFKETLDTALSGGQPAVTALKYASSEAGKIMREP